MGSGSGMGRRDGERDGDGIGAGTEEFGVSFASACGPGRDVCDVCCGSGFVAESGGVYLVDRDVSRYEDGRGDGCYGCDGLCGLDPVSDAGMLTCISRLREFPEAS